MRMIVVTSGAGMRHDTDQSERGNEVEPIAELRHDLPDPQSPERAIASQELYVR